MSARGWKRKRWSYAALQKRTRAYEEANRRQFLPTWQGGTAKLSDAQFDRLMATSRPHTQPATFLRAFGAHLSVPRTQMNPRRPRRPSVIDVHNFTGAGPPNVRWSVDRKPKNWDRWGSARQWDWLEKHPQTRGPRVKRYSRGPRRNPAKRKVTVADRRHWRTSIKRQQRANRQRVMDALLTSSQITRLMAGSRQAGNVSMARAMGMPLRVPRHLMNPRRPGGPYPDELPTLVDMPAFVMPKARRRRRQRMTRAQLGRMASWRGTVDETSFLRAMGIPLAPKTRNPRRSPMARRRNPARPGTQTYFRYGIRPRQGGRPRKVRRVGMAARARARGHASRRAYMGPVQGPLMASGFFDPSSAVTMGRRARGRGRATVYGPVQSPSLYRAKRRKPRRRAKPRRRTRTSRRYGRMPAGLARYWAAMGRRRRRRPARRAAPRKHRGRARTYRYGYGRKLRRSPRRIRTARRRAHQRSRQHLRAIRTIHRGQRIAGRVVRNPYTGRMEFMPTALVANPRRRRRGHASNPGRRRRRRSRRFIAAGRIVMNPGGGFFASAKSIGRNAIKPGLAALAGGAAVGLVASRITSPVFGALARAATGIAGAALLRRHPAAAWSFFGATVGSFGTQIGASLGGGLVAFTKGSLFKGLADMAAEDGEMAALLAGAGVEDIGDLVQMGDIADDDDALGDLVNDVSGLGDNDDEGGVGDDDDE